MKNFINRLTNGLGADISQEQQRSVEKWIGGPAALLALAHDPQPAIIEVGIAGEESKQLGEAQARVGEEQQHGSVAASAGRIGIGLGTFSGAMTFSRAKTLVMEPRRKASEHPDEVAYVGRRHLVAVGFVEGVAVPLRHILQVGDLAPGQVDAKVVECRPVRPVDEPPHLLGITAERRAWFLPGAAGGNIVLGECHKRDTALVHGLQAPAAFSHHRSNPPSLGKSS